MKKQECFSMMESWKNLSRKKRKPEIRKTDNAEDTDKEETVTEIFDIDDRSQMKIQMMMKMLMPVKKTDEPEGGFLDEDDVEIFETDDSDVVVLHPDDID